MVKTKEEFMDMFNSMNPIVTPEDRLQGKGGYTTEVQQIIFLTQEVVLLNNKLDNLIKALRDGGIIK